MTKARRPICALPWLHRFTNTAGEIQVCCSSEEYDNAVRGDDGKAMNIRDGLDDDVIMNAASMKRMRLEMLDGKWPALCRRCALTEDTGAQSRRNHENIHYAEELAAALAATRPDGSIDAHVRSMDLRLGNTCNLACRMCTPRLSDKWSADWGKIDQDQLQFTPEAMRELNGQDWYRDPRLRAQLVRQLPHLRQIHFAGGEPLIVPEMVDFLRACVDAGESSHIELTYNTNITLIPKDLGILWSKFDGVKLFCSVDGVGALNDFIRHPSKWTMVDRNLRTLDEQFEAYRVKEVLLSCTLQGYNVFGLDALYDYAASFRRIRRLPQLIDLHYPPYYRTQILPRHLKRQARHRLKKVLELSEARIAQGAIPRDDEWLLDSLRGSITFIMLEDLEQDIPRFRRAAESIDGFRYEDVYQTVPELLPLKTYKPSTLSRLRNVVSYGAGRALRTLPGRRWFQDSRARQRYRNHLAHSIGTGDSGA